jgi:hypothetical protein
MLKTRFNFILATKGDEAAIAAASKAGVCRAQIELWLTVKG